MKRRMLVLALALSVCSAEAETSKGGYRFTFNNKPVDPYLMTVNGPEPTPGDVVCLEDFYFCLDEAGDYNLTESFDCLIRKMPGGVERRIACKISAPADPNGDPSARLFRRKKPGQDVYSGFTADELKDLRGIRIADWSPTLEKWLGSFDLSRVCLLLESPALDGRDKPAIPLLPTTVRHLVFDTGGSWNCEDFKPLARLKDLRFLDLHDSMPAKVDLGLLAQLPLEFLSLPSYAPLEHVEALANMKSLRTLAANGCKQLGDGRILSGNTELRQFFARHVTGDPEHPVVPLDLKSFAGLKHLAVLEVAASSVGTLPDQTMPALKSADLLLADAPKEIISAFVKANSQAVIHHSMNAELRTALTKVDRLRVRTGGVCHRREEKEKTIVEIKDAPSIAEVVDHFQINEDDSGDHCMCCGNPTFELYEGEKLVATIGFHHGRSIRWWDGNWPGDGVLTARSSEFLIRWLAEEGCDGPRQEWLEQKRQEAAAKRRWQRYEALLPRDVTTAIKGAKTWDEIAHIVDQSKPAGIDGATLLLKLLGCDFELWNHYSGLDQALTETLLPAVPQDVLVKAILQCRPDTEEALGAVRWLFGEGKVVDWKDQVKGIEPLAKFALKHPQQSNRWRCIAILRDMGTPCVPLLREVMRAGTHPTELPKDELDEAGGMVTFHPGSIDLPEGSTDQQAAALCLQILNDQESMDEVARIRSQLSAEAAAKWDENVKSFQQYKARK